MTEKFRIQIPADGIGGIIVRSQYLAQRMTEDQTREHMRDLEVALDQIASRGRVVRASASVAAAPKINRRSVADCTPTEKAIVNLALDLAPNPRPLSLQPWLPGRSVQWVSAKLQQEMRARAQMPGSSAVEQAAVNRRVAGSNPARAATDAGGALQAVPTRPPDFAHVTLGNDEGSPRISLPSSKEQTRSPLENEDAVQKLPETHSERATTRQTAAGKGQGIYPSVFNDPPLRGLRRTGSDGSSLRSSKSENQGIRDLSSKEQEISPGEDSERNREMRRSLRELSSSKNEDSVVERGVPSSVDETGARGNKSTDARSIEGRPASALQQQIKDQVALLAEKDAEIQALRRAKDAMIEQRLLADRAIQDLREQLGAKDMVIDRLRRAQDRAPSTQARSWGLTPGATPMPQLATSMPDTGMIPLPGKEEKMRGR